MQMKPVWAYHHKGVANPERVPAVGARWDHDGLTVNCYHHGWSFTHSTPAHTHTHTGTSLNHTRTLRFSKSLHGTRSVHFLPSNT